MAAPYDNLYNLTLLKDADLVSDIFTYANDASNGTLFGIFTIVIFFTMLLIFKKWEFDEALLSSSFLSFVLSAILAYGGFVGIIYPLAYLAITAFTTFYVFVVKR